MEHKPAGAGERGADPEPVFSSRHDRRKVTDWVYEELREAILDLRLQPGEPLREAAIAEQLGVSKTPIREALTRLEQEGLVETTSFKGNAFSRSGLHAVTSSVAYALSTPGSEALPNAPKASVIATQ